jgi:uncharacterized cupin superfamily protein
VNVLDDEWGEQPEDWAGGGGRSKRAVGPGQLLGASVYEFDPGNFSVYHFHHGSEELLIVLRGRPTLRTPDGERVLAEGETVHFPKGPDGAHAIRNDTDVPVRFIVAGTRVFPEVVEYPDLKQITAQAPQGSQTGERLWFVHDVA